jgi:hypothetical protein
MKKRVFILMIVGVFLFMLSLGLNYYDCKGNYQELSEEYENKVEEWNQEEIQLQSKIKSLIENLSQEKVKFQSEIKSLSAIKYTPTFKEVKDILKNYEDNENYDDDYYNCVDYSQSLIKEFKENRIYSCMVNLYFKDGGHALVAVETSDKGVIYIEPQGEEIIYNLNEGQDYCEIVNWYCEKDEWKIEFIKSCFD